MAVDDIQAVLVVDAQAYPTPWREAGYLYELTKNTFAYYDVLTYSDQELIIGYCGYWLLVGECHISTIAIQPEWQGNGLGEVLFWHMQRQACGHQVALTTLEVRQSNKRAQSLYQKYGFVETGRRKGYYKDTSEDGLIMTMSPLDNAYCERLQQRGVAIKQKLRTLASRCVE